MQRILYSLYVIICNNLYCFIHQIYTDTGEIYMRRLILVGNLQEVTWGAFDSTLPNLPTIPNLAIPFCLNQMETALDRGLAGRSKVEIRQILKGFSHQYGTFTRSGGYPPIGRYSFFYRKAISSMGGITFLRKIDISQSGVKRINNGFFPAK